MPIETKTEARTCMGCEVKDCFSCIYRKLLSDNAEIKLNVSELPHVEQANLQSLPLLYIN